MSGVLRRAAYAAPILPLAIVQAPALSVLPSIYAKEAGVGMAALGTVLFLTRLFDAVIDPSIGYLSDGTRSRWGPRKLWIALGAVIVAIGCWFWFRPSAGTGLGYFLFWSLVVYLGWSLLEVPHSAWLADLSDDYDERSRLSAWRSSAELVERRVWRETQRDGFTNFDRRLLAAMDGEGMVGDAVGGKNAWAALTRGRLAHLESLGLAERQGRRFRLVDDLEGELRRLQSSKDVIRTLNQRRLETGKTAEVFREGRVSGRVMKAGFHDELGISPFAVVRDARGVEHYAQLAVGAALPTVGAQATLGMDARGVAKVVPDVGRGGEGLGL